MSISWQGINLKTTAILLLALAGSLALVPALFAATIAVGPTREHKELAAVADELRPGDVVEVDGNATYQAVWFKKPGTEGEKITVRGIRREGKRPVISGGRNTVELMGDHFVFEGFEVTGGSMRGIFHHADDVTVRDCVIHDCRSQGLLGAMEDSGSLLLEYCEFYNCGRGDRSHQIYMDTDVRKHPGAVFRMQHCWVHDGRGGNNVKSRAGRNEIYYNWIEGPYFHALELIGADGRAGGVRRDSDVVGNIVCSGRSSAARVGHDSRGGGSSGRYRFVNNTFLFTGSKVAFQGFGRLQSIEMHNNVLYAPGGGEIRVVTEEDAQWTEGHAVVSGTNNWVSAGARIPPGWKGTIVGNDPRFVDFRRFDLRPASASPLIRAGVMKTTSPAGADFPSPLALALFHPPMRRLEAPGSAQKRPSRGTIDIGAFQSGASQ